MVFEVFTRGRACCGEMCISEVRRDDISERLRFWTNEIPQKVPLMRRLFSVFCAFCSYVFDIIFLI